MTRKKGLKDFSEQEIVRELARRHAERTFREGMTLSDMENAVEELKAQTGEPSIALMLSRIKPEKPTAKGCPRCGKRTPVKARDRERTVKSLAGPVTFKRNYHYCEECKFGFYPVDRMLDLPEEGELSSELEKRVLDFAVNDVYGQAVQRWKLHYRVPISDNLLRCVASRVGARCEEADQSHLQAALKPAGEPAQVLVVEIDGSVLPICGPEPWKEAKVGVTYHHDPARSAPVPGSARYVAVVGTMANFAPVLQEALITERIDEVGTVVFLADGAPCNWNLADQLAPDAVQILDWYHAVLHAVDCGKVLLGEESDFLPLWKLRSEQLLAEGDVNAFIRELMDCLPALGTRGKREALEAIDALIRYYRENAHRMKYKLYRAHGLPLGSGAVESAHRHVLQVRMKRAGQHWQLRNARRMAHLRAAYRTGGATQFYGAIQRAHRDTERGKPRRDGRRHAYRFARDGERDRLRARAASM